jgi:hypothetical protein
MKYFLRGKKKIIISLLFGVMFISCSDQKQTSSENSKNKELIDSLAIEKSEKSIEVKELNSELDSLKKLRDSLKTNSK